MFDDQVAQDVAARQRERAAMEARSREAAPRIREYDARILFLIAEAYDYLTTHGIPPIPVIEKPENTSSYDQARITGYAWAISTSYAIRDDGALLYGLHSEPHRIPIEVKSSIHQDLVRNGQRLGLKPGDQFLPGIRVMDLNPDPMKGPRPPFRPGTNWEPLVHAYDNGEEEIFLKDHIPRRLAALAYEASLRQ